MRLIKHFEVIDDSQAVKHRAKFGYYSGWWLTVLLLHLNPVDVICKQLKKAM